MKLNISCPNHWKDINAHFKLPESRLINNNCVKNSLHSSQPDDVVKKVRRHALAQVELEGVVDSDLRNDDLLLSVSSELGQWRKRNPEDKQN